MSQDTQVFNLGFPLARLEADENGEPLLTIVSPASADDPPKEMIIGAEGVEGLLAIAHRLRYWNEKHPTAGGGRAIDKPEQ